MLVNVCNAYIIYIHTYNIIYVLGLRQFKYLGLSTYTVEIFHRIETAAECF